MDVIMIKDNYEEVERRIRRACDASGRNRNDVKLISVSKTKPVSDIKEAMECGAVVFGENKVQELTEKYDVLPKNLEWHMIGHLQRNKVKYIVGKVACIHSVDSLRLAEQIDAESRKSQVVTNILIEVNVAGEDTKFGVSPMETEALVREISHLEHVHICGLMTIAPYTIDAESNRIYFKKLRELAVDIEAKNIDNVSMRELSMGMTGDYEVAVEEGATMIRVGTGIFGMRDYQQR